MHTRINLSPIMSLPLPSAARTALICLVLLWTPFLLRYAFAQAEAESTAQTGVIFGTVVDASTGESLIGVNVSLEGTTVGRSTDLDGEYRIEHIAPGTYNVLFSYIGYTRTVVRDVEVVQGEGTRIDIALEEEVLDMGGEVVVEARAARNTEAALIKERQKAIAVSDAISAEEMSRAGVGNAADAMSRVTGATVIGGKFVTVRGLGGRYGNAKLNGATLPSTDPDRNAAQLDLFPSNLLDNIVATKTFTPDQPGSFSGGSVDVRTKDFPDRLTFSVSSSASWNNRSSLRDDFLLGPRTDSDWLGLGSDERALPEPLTAQDLVIPSQVPARRNKDMASVLDAVTRSFDGTMIPSSTSSGLDQGYGVSLGNNVSLLGRPLGFITSGTYGRSFRAVNGGNTSQYSLTSPEAEELVVDYDLNDTAGNEEVSWGILGNATYRFHPHHEAGFNFFRSQVSDQEGRYQNGPFPKNSPAAFVFETYSLRYTERSVASYQGRGEHFFRPLLGAKVDWMWAQTTTVQDEPDLRFFFNQYVETEPGDPTSRSYFINLGSSNATPPTRLFRNMEETNREAAVNVEIPFQLGVGRKGMVKLGGSSLEKDRTFRERKFDYVNGANSFASFEGDIGAFFGEENVGIIAEENGRFTFGNTIRDGSSKANNYDGFQDVTAAYAMLDMPITRWLRFIGGVRREATDMEIVSQDTTKDAGILKETDWLPSANIIFALSPEMNVRLAATRTLARPTFREKAPFVSFDFAGGRQTAGNVDLERTLITNLDLRWEWYFRPGELLSVSGFYKYFQDPIERVIVSNNAQESFQNVPSATVRGMEFELRRRLGFIADWLDQVTFSSNVALIVSETDVPERELEFAEGFDISTTRPFQDQSPYVLNLGLSYDNYESGLAASVDFNRNGKRLSHVSLGGTPNIFEYARNDLGVSVSKRFVRNVTVKLAASNLLDAGYVQAYEYQDTRYTARSYHSGRTLKMSVTYEL